MDISLIEEKLLEAKKELFRKEIQEAMKGVKKVLDAYVIVPIRLLKEDDRAQAKAVIGGEIMETFFRDTSTDHDIGFWGGWDARLPEAFYDNLRKDAVGEFLEKVESLKEQVEEIESVLPV